MATNQETSEPEATMPNATEVRIEMERKAEAERVQWATERAAERAQWAAERAQLEKMKTICIFMLGIAFGCWIFYRYLGIALACL